MFIICSVSVIDKSNNIIDESFKIKAENIFEIKIEQDCLSTNVQNSMYLKEDDCYVKKEIPVFTNSSLLSSVKEKITPILGSDDNYQSHNTEQ